MEFLLTTLTLTGDLVSQITMVLKTGEQMYTNDGKWDDTNSNMYYAFIVEFNYLRDDEISGYTKLTDYNGHSYYYDYVGYIAWTTARDRSKALGGNLVIINDAVENEVIRDAARKISSRSVYIGLYQNTSSDEYSELPSDGVGRSAVYYIDVIGR